MENYDLVSVKLFGIPALFSSCRIRAEDIPKGYAPFMYDLRGSDNDPGQPVSIEELVLVNHAGTILTSHPLWFPKNRDSLKIGEELDFSDSADSSIEEYFQMMGDYESTDEEKAENEEGMVDAVIVADEEMLYSNCGANLYGLYQLNSRIPGVENYIFEGSKYMKEQGYDISAEKYSLTYAGVLNDADTLEDLYVKFNISHPRAFTGRSASVSDVIVLNRNGNTKAYYIDVFGFAELPNFAEDRMKYLNATK